VMTSQIRSHIEYLI